MALITCPKCGKQFSEHAKACPQCGITKEDALALIKKQEEEIRLAAEREAAERERQRQEYLAEQERLRKEREEQKRKQIEEEARAAKEKREKRAAWWKKNGKKVWITIAIIVVIIVAIIAIVKIKDVIDTRRLNQKVEAIFLAGDSCVNVFAFEKAEQFYQQAKELKNDEETINLVAKKRAKLSDVKRKAEKEYDAALRKLGILLDADDNEFNQYSSECLDKMIEIYPDRQETIYYKNLRDEKSSNNIGDEISEEDENESGELIEEPIVIDENEWLYGEWRCETQYGTIVVIIQEGGSIYDGIEEKWASYTIEGDRLIEQLDGYISSYNIDRANKRFDAGEAGEWFEKVSN